MMPFQTLQLQFLAHLRAPERHALPEGFAKRGATLYANLLYNKFNDSLRQCFPVTQALLGEEAWRQLLQAFIAGHRCLSPYYRQIPDEFIRYLQTERQCASDPPYLLELAHFEWVEMALAIVEAEAVTTGIQTGIKHWLDCRPQFVPVCQLLNYVYPVQRINADYQPAAAPEQATHILGFRDVSDDVQFIELQPATARLLEILQSTGCTLQAAIVCIAEETAHPEPSALFDFGVETIAQLLRQGAIIAMSKEMKS